MRDKCFKSTARKCQSWGLNWDVLELFLFLTTTQHSQIKSEELTYVMENDWNRFPSSREDKWKNLPEWYKWDWDFEKSDLSTGVSNLFETLWEKSTKKKLIPYYIYS